MSSLANTLDELRSKIRSEFPVFKKYFDLIEQKTHVNIEYFVLGAGVLLALCVFSGFGAHFISLTVGFIYPAYATMVAIESPQKDDDTMWLMYWVVFSVFTLVENFMYILVNHLPLYFPMKITLLLWCMLPKYKGSQWIYNNIVQPNFLKSRSAIDKALNSVDPKAVLEKSD